MIAPVIKANEKDIKIPLIPSHAAPIENNFVSAIPRQFLLVSKLDISFIHKRKKSIINEENILYDRVFIRLKKVILDRLKTE